MKCREISTFLPFLSAWKFSIFVVTVIDAVTMAHCSFILVQGCNFSPTIYAFSQFSKSMKSLPGCLFWTTHGLVINMPVFILVLFISSYLHLQKEIKRYLWMLKKPTISLITIFSNKSQIKVFCFFHYKHLWDNELEKMCISKFIKMYSCFDFFPFFTRISRSTQWPYIFFSENGIIWNLEKFIVILIFSFYYWKHRIQIATLYLLQTNAKFEICYN